MSIHAGGRSLGGKMTLPRATVLRAKAAFALGRVLRDGTPRSRFLLQAARDLQRPAVTLFGTLAAIALATGGYALGTAVATPLVLRALALAAVFSGGALAVAAKIGTTLQQRFSALTKVRLAVVLTLVAALVLVPEAALVLVPLLVTLLWLLPLPPVLVVPIGALATAVAGSATTNPRASLYAGCTFLLTLVSAVHATGTHRRTLREFRTRERQNGALLRLTQIQEQLVVTLKLEALRVFVGGMSHELNNALVVAEGNVQVAQRGLSAVPEASKPLEKARGGLGRIRTIVERLRAFALAEPGVRDRIALEPLVDFAIANAVGDLPHATIERAYNDVGSVFCAPSALAEVVYLVVRNAVEAVARNGDGVGIVHVALERPSPEEVVLRVRDNGPGLAKSVLSRIFDPFYKPNTKELRTGLGLSAALGLVHGMGGTLRVQSTLGRGTEVAVHLRDSA